MLTSVKMKANLEHYFPSDNCCNGLKVVLILQMGSYMFIELEKDDNTPCLKLFGRY